MTDFLVYWCFLLLILAFVGNYLIFKIYSLESMRRNRLAFYFRLKAVFNNLLMLQMVKHVAAEKFNWYFELQSDLTCRLSDYSENVSQCLNVWILVFITLDRFVTIRFPRRFPLLAQRKVQIALVIAIFVYYMLIFSFMLWNFQLIATPAASAGAATVNSSSLNDSNLTTYYCVNSVEDAYALLDLLNSHVLPLSLMLMSSVAFIVFIGKSRNRVNLTSNRIRSKDRKFAFTVLSLNMIFLVTNMPHAFYNLFSDSLSDSDPDLASFLTFLFSTLLYTNYALDFFFQLTLNSLLRKEFSLILINIKVHFTQHLSCLFFFQRIAEFIF
jgi:hypothetical protein